MPNDIELKYDLKIDYREQRSGIVFEIEKLSNLVRIEVSNLKVGDYCIGDKILIERKSVKDFNTSIISGRLFRQAYRIAQSGKNGLIILEGNESSTDMNSLSRKVIQGALIHINVFIGIPLIRSINIQDTAAILISILRQSQKQKMPRKSKIISRIPGIKINKSQRQKLFVLQNLPGIGTIKAIALLKSFNTIENNISASQDDFTRVRGIGKKLAFSIYALLHEAF